MRACGGMAALSHSKFRFHGYGAGAAHFPTVDAIKYEGADSLNPLSFKHYNAEEVVEGKVGPAIVRLVHQ